MKRELFSWLLLLTGVTIALGFLGHSFLALHKVEEALAGHSVSPEVTRTIIVVWQFAGACMAIFGTLIVWQWRQLRLHADRQIFVPFVIGVFYVLFGVYSTFTLGKPFYTVFAVLGGSLVICAFSLGSATARRERARFGAFPSDP